MQMHVFELMASTLQKVANRVRQILNAHNQGDRPSEQLNLIGNTLTEERAEMHNLFSFIESKLESFPQNGQESVQPEIAEWSRRWLRVFRRKWQVEEGWVLQELHRAEKDDVSMENGDAEASGTLDA